ncbi:DUF2946 domain-containing protein [Pseudomonas matsuisoli]|uniref:DUF2946 domain-containing protein n=1 Tax=Pseudomonas matsuisoli TaxID=1515666 RepID=UPI001667F988|nr:DUF2946 domain-containing protein [Pseudomonas matsuisoli]
MKPSDQRLLVAWLLMLCIAVNVFACSVGHGQGMGLALSGIFDGGFCTLGLKAPSTTSDVAAPAADSNALLFLKCPFCASVPLSTVALLALMWIVRTRNAIPRVRSDGHHAVLPRDERPPLNPRAP